MQIEGVGTCLCEYVDVGVGSILAVPSPECPVHTAEVLRAMTYMRHEMERSVGITPTRTHWAHEECPCGCGEGGCSA